MIILPANTAISGKVPVYKALYNQERMSLIILSWYNLVHFQKITNRELIKKKGKG